MSRYTPPKVKTKPCRGNPTGQCEYTTRMTVTDKDTGQRTTTRYCSFCGRRQKGTQ